MKKILYIIFLFEFILGQTIQINEIVSTNGTVLYDEDGDTPDWIELHNPTNESINLLGYGATDDPEDLSKWIFPSIEIAPNNFLVIFASDKDRTEYIVQWDAKIDWGDSWHYWVGTSAPISNWEHPETDINFWPIGNSGFGYGDNDDNTETPQITSIFIKKNFEIDDPSIINKALFHIDYDDGYVAYLNGVEFSRRNLGEAGSLVEYNATTTGLHEAEIYSGGFPEKNDINLQEFPILEGTNVMAIEVHNYSNTSSDLSCIPFLTLGYNTEIENTNLPNDLMDIPNSFLHTNFKISSSGETLLISDPTETILDSITIGSINTDMSYGRYLEGESWALFNEPTPGSSNSTSSYLGSLSLPEFSLGTGFYDQDYLSIELTSPDEAATIYFTIDGRIPTTSDFSYEYPITVSSNIIIRARAFLDQWVPSDIGTKTYVLGQDHPVELPAIFITTDPNSFFDEDTGMYVMGPNANTDFPYFGANFWEDWERPIHFEILETNGSGYAADAGSKIFGGWSRAFPQKSLSIFSRSHIGPSSFDYQLFPESDINSYESFVLRNSGNDWESTVLRDGFITSLAENLDIDHQRYRPAILYINGEFWGIQNIREKINEHFLSSNHSIASEHIDLLDIQGVNDENIVHGTNTDYQTLINYLETQDMTDPIVQNAIENWIDIESYMSYQAFQIFAENRDWPGNNIKFWRDHRVGGKWRWILYDTDFGFGIWDPNAYTFNTLEFALDPNGPGWPNPPWSTFVFRKLLENRKFKNSFINIYCDLLNTVFQSNFLSERLDSISAIIENTIPSHRARWYNDGNWPNSTVNWDWRLEVMENFGNNRRIYAINHLQDEFELPNNAYITLNTIPEDGGSIHLNTLHITESNWSGYYFPTIPIGVQARQNDGYEFSHWLQYPDSSMSMEIDISDPFVLTAVFNETTLNPGNVVINEINYNSNDNHDSGDWIELYNPGEMPIDISGWVMKDDDYDNSYNIPDGTILYSDYYLIITKDPTQFYEYYSSDIPAIGPFDFGLGGGGDDVKIFNNLGELIDSVRYDDNDPWPGEPDGDGPTLELKNAELDNSIHGSWTASENYGTPGEQNSSFETLMLKAPSIYPDEIRLYSCYPNPFNPATNIMFEVPLNESNHKTQLQIFNLRGQLVQIILNSYLKPGNHNIRWEPKNISSGIYILQLKVGRKILNQKITFLK